MRIGLLLLSVMVLATPRPQAVYAHPVESNSGGRAMIMVEQLDREIPRPKPVVHGGIRYEAVRNARMRGFKQSGGIVVAIDEKSGRDLWTLQIYELTFDKDEERDVQEVFITQLRIDPAGKNLEVTNERKQVYLVALADRSVTLRSP